MKLFFITLITLAIFSCNNKNTKVNNSILNQKITALKLPEHIFSKIQNGDIILRKGAGPLSAHLMLNTKEEYTHCGIIFNDNGKWMAIHSIGGEISNDNTDGIQTITLEKFVAPTPDSTLFICRPVFTKNAGDKVYKKGLEYLQKGYPFDHRFSLLTTDELYCSEMLYHIFKDINNGKNVFDIKKKHKSYMLMFSTFFKEKNFVPIYDMRKDK
jgi:hypothetical protein